MARRCSRSEFVGRKVPLHEARRASRRAADSQPAILAIAVALLKRPPVDNVMFDAIITPLRNAYYTMMGDNAGVPHHGRECFSGLGLNLRSGITDERNLATAA